MITLKNILVATDFSEPSDAALTYGRELAGRFDATLHVLHVRREHLHHDVRRGNLRRRRTRRCSARSKRRRARSSSELLIDSDDSGPPTTPVVLTSSSPAFAIIDYAGEHGIDLIVMGTHGRGAPGAHADGQRGREGRAAWRRARC